MQQRYIKLNRILKYKTFITALLLAVYAFIASPVQLWHHHTYETNNGYRKSFKEKKVTSFSAFSKQVKDLNCQICSHYYSIFIDAKAVRLEVPFIVAQSVEQHYVFSIPSPPFLHFSNKGPPTLS